MANLKLKRVKIPVLYTLRTISPSTHLPVLIQVMELDVTNQVVSYRTKKDKTWREISLDIYRLMYKPWKK